MDARPIDANALLTVPNVKKVTEFDETGCGMDYLAVPMDAVETAPTLDYAPVAHGEWLEAEKGVFPMYCGRCSRCGATREKENYCPNCGAKMVGGKKHD